MSILKVWQLTLIWQNKTPLGELDRKKGFFNPLLMRKHDFWHVQWYLNGQKWGVKKSISVWPFWRFDNWLLFGKTRPPGGSWIEKKAFLTLFWWENMISDRSSCYLMVKNGGLKKHLSMSILKVWQLIIIWQNKIPLGGELDRKKGFFNPLLMRKHDFWHVQWYLNGQKWGVKKASLYDHFKGLTTDSYLAKQDPLGGGWIEKKAFLTLFWWENMISDMVQWYLNGQKWGVKKSISVWPFWRFDNWLLFGKARGGVG